jgi:hypothetical protein
MKLIAIALLFVALPAIAQTPRTATITFDAPTTYTDGSLIESPISYFVYQGARGATKPQVATITGTSTTITTGLQAGQEYCWEVTAVVNGVESARSNEACKSFPLPVPSAVTITVQ